METGGPAVTAEARPGYGTSIIRDLIPYELGGAVDLKLRPDGVRCRLLVPAKWLNGGDSARHALNGTSARSTTGRAESDERAARLG
jgi:hypothetical protein